MAKRNLSRVPAAPAADRYVELKARFIAEGMELFIDDGGISAPAAKGPRYYICDPELDRVVVVTDEKGAADWFKRDENETPASCAESSEAESAIVQGGEKLPAELLPALALYERLLAEGESMSVKAITRYLNDADAYLAGGNNDDYVYVRPNLTERGVAFQYALNRLHYILCGTEPADLPTTAEVAPSLASVHAELGKVDTTLGEIFEITDAWADNTLAEIGALAVAARAMLLTAEEQLDAVAPTAEAAHG